MSLFGQLADDIFLIFSRANRHFYARVVVELFERFFSDTVTFPGRQEVVGAIYDTLKSHPDLWTEDDDDFSDVPEPHARGRRFRRSAGDGRQDLLLNRAQSVYAMLKAKGWLDEESYGIRVTVDMPPAAMLLAERLAAIEKGLATSFRGVVITIRNALSSVHQDPRTNALGLNKAAELTLRFSQELRAVLSHLRTIERDILRAESLDQRLASFFEDFIGKLVLKDFESIYKTNHPFRFKREILELAEMLAEENSLRDQVVEGYIEGELAPVRTAAGALLDADLLTIRTVFDNIDLTYDRINGFRVRLEARLRNMINYAERGNQMHSRRLENLIVRLDQACGELAQTDPAWLRRRQPEAPVVNFPPPWAVHLLAEPRGPRAPVAPGILRRPQQDPVLAQWRLALRHYNDLFVDDISRVQRFLEARILPGSVGEARYLAIETVTDFLAFEHLRRLLRDPPAALREHFELEACPFDPWRDDDWIACENFLIHRKSAHLTLAMDQTA